MALSKKQRDAIEQLVSHPFIKKGEVAKAVDVDRTTVSNWMKKQEFLDAWDARLAECGKDSIRNAQRKMNELVEKGDFRAIQYVLDSGGFKAKQEIDVNSEGINININYEK